MPFVTVNDKPIYYESVGTGEPLVLIHALLMNGRMWADQVAVFSEKYRVITVDLYGYGKSKLTDVRIVDHPADDAMKARANAMMDEYDFCHFLDDTLLWKEYGAVADRLNAITCPVLVMAGDNEHPNYLAVETAEYVASKFPNAKKTIIANAGHFINWQQPEAFNRAVLDFLAD